MAGGFQAVNIEQGVTAGAVYSLALQSLSYKKT